MMLFPARGPAAVAGVAQARAASSRSSEPALTPGRRRTTPSSPAEAAGDGRCSSPRASPSGSAGWSRSTSSTSSWSQGSIVSVIGPNGAGKTTFFNCIAGFYRIDEGEIAFDGTPIHELRRDQIARLGIARTYQNIRLFASMTAIENVLVGQHHHLHTTWIGAILDTRGGARGGGEAHEEARRLLRVRRPPRATASSGEQAALRRPAPAGDRPGARPPSRACCCSTSRRPA